MKKLEIKQETLNKVQTAAGIFVTVGVGVAICYSIPLIKNAASLQAADYLWKMADANRIASLAKKYDAMAAANQIKDLSQACIKTSTKLM